jgi:hypothetical protein
MVLLAVPSAKLRRPVRPLAAVERFFERLFERPSARLFHSQLQPVQIQRRLERAMDTGRVFSGDRAYVPNRYTVTLNPADAEAFDGFHSRVEDDLGDALHARARARGYRLIARPTVSLRVSGEVARGDIEVDAEVLDREHLKTIDGHDVRVLGPSNTGQLVPAMGPGPAPGLRIAPVEPARIAISGTSGSAQAGGATSSKPGAVNAPVGRLPSEDRAVPLRPGHDRGVLVMPPDASRPATPPTGAYVRVDPSDAVAAAPADGAASRVTTERLIATLEVRTHNRLVANRAFDGGTLRVGRARDNDVVLADDRVSRYHGQLTARRGVLVYSDLGSTNGSFLNGTRVREIVLGSGDVVRLGNSTLTIQSQP